jgi:DNA-binding CsgD family transcriptional regulator
VNAAAGYDVGGGVVAFTVRIGKHTHVSALRQSQATSDDDVRSIATAIGELPVSLARRIFVPTEFAGNSAYRLARIARETRGPLAAAARRAGAELPLTWALIAGDPAKTVVLLCFPRDRRAKSSPQDAFPHSDGRALGLVGAHLGAALRLRAIARPSPDDSDTEAVLSPGGDLLHASGAATHPRSRASLAEAVLASRPARDHLRRTAPDEALHEWTSLVDGRWTIVDVVERNGRRLVLARRNELATPGLLDLAPEERDVAWLTACGHSNKYIAYQLGCPISTVAGRLRRALRKLALPSRAELVRRLGVPRAA